MSVEVELQKIGKLYTNSAHAPLGGTCDGRSGPGSFS